MAVGGPRSVTGLVSARILDLPAALAARRSGTVRRARRGELTSMLRTFAGGRLFGSRHRLGAPRVLALHGWARTHRDFDAVVAPGRRSRRLPALALDLPGFGASPPPPEAWGAAAYAEAVGQVLGEMSARSSCSAIPSAVGWPCISPPSARVGPGPGPHRRSAPPSRSAAG